MSNTYCTCKVNNVFRIMNIFFQFKEYKEYITILYIPKILFVIIDESVPVKYYEKWSGSKE